MTAWSCLPGCVIELGRNALRPSTGQPINDHFGQARIGVGRRLEEVNHRVNGRAASIMADDDADHPALVAGHSAHVAGGELDVVVVGSALGSSPSTEEAVDADSGHRRRS